MVFTSLNEKQIQIRQYELPLITEAGIYAGDLEMSMIGPVIDLELRRHQEASADLFKTAVKQPKLETPDTRKLRKKTTTNALGQKFAKVYVQQQDYDTLVQRRFKLRLGTKEEKRASVKVPKKNKKPVAPSAEDH